MREFIEHIKKAELRIKAEKSAYMDTVITDDSAFGVFDCRPVSLDDFLYSKEFLRLEKLSEKQYEFIKYGTQIYYEEELDTLGWEKLPYKKELVALWGKGSGKDYCSAILCSRIIYELLCLKTPLQYYQQSHHSHIDILNMAYTSNQAEDNFFAYFSDMIKGSKWFNSKWDEKGSRMLFPKKIRAFSGNSYEESFEGKNLIVCVLDEIAAFKTDAEIEQARKRKVRTPRYSASAVYDMATTSINSRFPGVGKLVSLSFPRYKNDFIEQLYESCKDEITCYRSKGATWEVNPNRKKEDFASDYRRNPERSMARYECITSEKMCSFFKKPESISVAFKEITDAENPVTDEYSPKLKSWFYPEGSFGCSIHIDLGWKHDSAGIAMSHCYAMEYKDDISLPKIKIDLATSFIAPINGEIDFESIRNFILELKTRGFNIRVLSLDGWNSVYFLQTFARVGIETKLRSVDRTPEAYEDLKSLIYENRIIGYFAPRTIFYSGVSKIVYELRDELKGLIDMGGKRGPEHTCGGTGKDISDSVAGSVQGAIELGLGGFGKDDVHIGKDRQTFSDDRLGEREYLVPMDSLGYL